MTEGPKAHIFCVAEAIIDEVQHLPPCEAGAALGMACHQHGIDTERKDGDAAALAFYEAIETACRTARERLLGYIAKDAAR